VKEERDAIDELGRQIRAMDERIIELNREIDACEEACRDKGKDQAFERLGPQIDAILRRHPDWGAHGPN
jgi:hypothetical protein